MKKKKFILISSVCLLLILTVVLIVRTVQKNSPVESTAQIDTSGKYEMHVVEDTVTNTGLTFTIKNNNTLDITFGADYFLECYKDGVWYNQQISGDGIAIITIEYGLPGKREENYSVEWSEAYGKLKPGKYRILRTVTDYYGERHTLAAEFTIE